VATCAGRQARACGGAEGAPNSFDVPTHHVPTTALRCLEEGAYVKKVCMRPWQPLLFRSGHLRCARPALLARRCNRQRCKQRIHSSRTLGAGIWVPQLKCSRTALQSSCRCTRACGVWHVPQAAAPTLIEPGERARLGAGSLLARREVLGFVALCAAAAVGSDKLFTPPSGVIIAVRVCCTASTAASTGKDRACENDNLC